MRVVSEPEKMNPKSDSIEFRKPIPVVSDSFKQEHTKTRYLVTSMLGVPGYFCKISANRKEAQDYCDRSCMRYSLATGQSIAGLTGDGMTCIHARRR